MKFEFRGPDFKRFVLARAAELKRDRKRAARIVADKQSKAAQRGIQARMRSVGLAKLSYGVRQSSSLKKRSDDRTREFGVVYAAGHWKVDNRTAGAIEAYSQGVTIRSRYGTYVAYATSALPRFIGNRRRMTPRLYQTTGWAARLGPLEFRPISRDMALLVIKNVTLHAKTGRAKRAGPGKARTRVAVKETVAFVLIRQTRRAQRFDPKSIAGVYARQIPNELAATLGEIRGRRSAGG